MSPIPVSYCRRHDASLITLHGTRTALGWLRGYWPGLLTRVPISCGKDNSGSPGIPVVTGQNSFFRHAKPLEILGRPSNDILFSREFRESHNSEGRRRNPLLRLRKLVPQRTRLHGHSKLTPGQAGRSHTRCPRDYRRSASFSAMG